MREPVIIGYKDYELFAVYYSKVRGDETKEIKGPKYS
jgi:hypothetical protein